MAHDSTKEKHRFKKILKIIGYSFLGMFVLLLVAGTFMSVYFNKHKDDIVSEINLKINENIKGKVSIGDVGYTLVKGFPSFALTINNVVVKDSLWEQHKHTLLISKEIEVHVDIKKLVFSNEVDIKKIQINDATIDIYVDKNGVTNSDIFKPKHKDTAANPKKKIIIEAVALNNVKVISQNIKLDKLFDFDVTELESKIQYTNTGWQTDLFVNTLAKSMAFKLSKGSFIKDKQVKGTLSLTYSTSKNNISVDTKKLKIGEDSFDIIAHFNLDKKNPLFDLDINTEITWKNAAILLDAHIYKILNHLDIKKPLQANCKINGNMSVQGNPDIVVKAIVKNNVLTTPDGIFTNCSFNGEYNNNYKKGLGAIDENSAVIVTDFSASFDKIPFSMPKAMIYNLTIPTASGTFKSNFEVTKLNQYINSDLMNFSEGVADVNLKFIVNVSEFKLKKPLFAGNININQATLNYISKNISFKKTDILLNFTENNLSIKKLKFTNGTNTVLMNGKINNFLDLYYNDPGKMIIDWNVYSTNFNFKDFLTMLAYKNKKKTIKVLPKKLISGKLQSMINDCQVNIDISADKVFYNKLNATNFTTNIQLKNDQLLINKGSINTCKGEILFDAQLIPSNNLYNFSGNANIKTVNIPQFLTAFDNFGITSFEPKNIKGNLTLTTSVKGSMTQNGDLVDKSLNGNVNYSIKNGELDNFAPIMKVGKIVFPNRDVKNIIFNDLEGSFNLKNGELVTVDLFKVSSNVLNFDVYGIYSFGKGTDLKMTIPLRNPKDDYLITDSIQRANLRYKGIVAHVQAYDDANGKIEIKLDPQDVEISNPFKRTKPKKSKKNEK